jgi:hypothetical protein
VSTVCVSVSVSTGAQAVAPHARLVPRLSVVHLSAVWHMCVFCLACRACVAVSADAQGAVSVGHSGRGRCALRADDTVFLVRAVVLCCSGAVALASVTYLHLEDS